MAGDKPSRAPKTIERYEDKSGVKDPSKPKKKRATPSKKKTPGKKSVKKGGAKKEKGEKRPLSAYMLFAKDKRPEVIKKNPGLSFGEVGKKLGELWGSAKAADKKKYQDQAEKLKKK